MYAALHKALQSELMLMMSWLEPAPLPKSSDPVQGVDAEQLLRLQIGAVSPLWFMFLGAAGAGLAAWSLSRWAQLAAPETFTQNVTRLRLVKPATTPTQAAEAPTPEPQPQQPEPLKAEPLKAELEAEPAAVVETLKAAAPEPVAVETPKTPEPKPEPKAAAPVSKPAPLKAVSTPVAKAAVAKPAQPVKAQAAPAAKPLAAKSPAKATAKPAAKPKTKV